MNLIDIKTECSLCHGQASMFDSLKIVTGKRTYVNGRPATEYKDLTIYICKECTDRYKVQQYRQGMPNKGVLISIPIFSIIGIIWLVINLSKHPPASILFPIIMILALPLITLFRWIKAKIQFSPSSPPLDPKKLWIESPEVSASVYNCAGEVEYMSFEAWKYHERNPTSGYSTTRAQPITYYKNHPLTLMLKNKEQQEKQNQRQQKPEIKLVTMQEEELPFVKALIDQFGNGNEFTARNVFHLISVGYVEWYKKTAQSNNVYLINARESASLELIEFLCSKGVLGNKRIEVRNEYGDEDWHYTIMKS